MNYADSSPKTIRSFTIRGGKLTSGQQRALEHLWPLYGLGQLPSAGYRIDFEKIFGRLAPAILEIGFGDGKALLEAAQQNPQQDFIGVEVHKPGIGHLLLRLHQYDITNVRVICDDAIEVLQHGIKDESLSKVCLFFPDPWPKKKHNKRRIVQSHFITLLENKLLPGGVFHFSTDWQEYADEALCKLDQSTRLENLAGKGDFSPRPDTRPETKFEIRGQRLGHEVRDIIMIKRNE
jgi:tRNA (guanine-N7-)-methyltransferase